MCQIRWGWGPMQDQVERAALVASARSQLGRELKAAQVKRELKAAEDFFELAKNASSPFMRAYYRRVAERYLSSHGLEPAKSDASTI